MNVVRRACGPFFVLAGAMHFVKPRVYRQIVPPIYRLRRRWST